MMMFSNWMQRKANGITRKKIKLDLEKLRVKRGK